MVTYELSLQSIVKDVRFNVGDMSFDNYKDEQILSDLEDAFDFICMITDGTPELRYIRRCTIRYAAYISYRNYVSMSERSLGTIPEGSPMILHDLQTATYACLSYISEVPLNPDLSINLNTLGAPVAGQLSPSLLE